MSRRTHVPGGRGTEDKAHEHSATAPDYLGLLHAIGDLVRCFPWRSRSPASATCTTRDGSADSSRSACSTSSPRRSRWPNASATARKKPPLSAGSTRPGWISCWLNKTSCASKTTDGQLPPESAERTTVPLLRFPCPPMWPGTSHCLPSETFVHADRAPVADVDQELGPGEAVCGQLGAQQF